MNPFIPPFQRPHVASCIPAPETEGDCPICLEPFSKADPAVRVLPCAHLIGHTCLCSWMALSRTCPFCRVPLTPFPPPLEFSQHGESIASTGARIARGDGGQNVEMRVVAVGLWVLCAGMVWMLLLFVIAGAVQPLRESEAG